MGVSPEIGSLAQQTDRHIAALARVGCEALELFPSDKGYPMYTHPYSSRPFALVRRNMQVSPPDGNPIDVDTITDTTGLTVDAVDLSDEAVRLIMYKPNSQPRTFVMPCTRSPRKLTLTLAEQRNVFIGKVIEIDEAGNAADTYEPENTDPIALVRPAEEGTPQECANAGYIRAYTERTLITNIIASVLSRTYGIDLDVAQLQQSRDRWVQHSQDNPVTKLDDPRFIAVGRSFVSYEK